MGYKGYNYIGEGYKGDGEASLSYDIDKNYLRVWAYKIFLDERYTQNSDIGLFTPDDPETANSTIRLVENNIPGILGLGEFYRDGIITSVSPISEICNLKNQGNPTAINNTSFGTINTEEIWEYLEANSINILGRRCDVIEFVRDIVAEETKGYRLASMIVDSISYNDTEITWGLVTSNTKRKAPLGTLINPTSRPGSKKDDDGVCIPVTYGSFIKADGEEIFARGQRTEYDNENILNKKTLNCQIDAGTGSFGGDIVINNQIKNTMFPIIGTMYKTNSIEVGTSNGELRVTSGNVAQYIPLTYKNLIGRIFLYLKGDVGTYIKIIFESADGSAVQIGNERTIVITTTNWRWYSVGPTPNIDETCTCYSCYINMGHLNGDFYIKTNSSGTGARTKNIGEYPGVSLPYGFVYDKYSIFTKINSSAGGDFRWDNIFSYDSVLGENVPKEFWYVLNMSTSKIPWKDESGISIDQKRINITDLTANSFMKITSGENSGESIKIKNAEIWIDWVNLNSNILLIKCESYYSNASVVHITANETDQMWACIYSATKKMELDTWKLDGYYDENGLKLIDKVKTYSYVSEPILDSSDVIVTPDKQFSILSENSFADSLLWAGNNNTILLNSEKCINGEIDNLTGLVILPITSFKPSDFGQYIPGQIDHYHIIDIPHYKVREGTYCRNGMNFNNLDFSEFGIKDNVLNNNRNLFYQYRWTCNANTSVGDGKDLGFVLFFDIKLPKIANFKYDNVYLGVDIELYNSWSDVNHIWERLSFFCNYDRFMGLPNEILPIADGENYGALSWLITTKQFRNIPDYYYGIKTNNFYEKRKLIEKNIPSTLDDWLRYSGLENFKFTESETFEKFNAIDTVHFYLWAYKGKNGTDSIGNYLQAKFYHLCVIFEKKASVAESVYTHLKGRVFNDTWGGRKTATDLISNPIDTLEHVNRLQDFSELSHLGYLPPAGGWGQAYSTAGAVAIDTSTTPGGFDSLLLTSVKNAAITRQIHDYDDTYTDRLKESLCQNFFLISRQKTYTDITDTTEIGKEQVYSLFEASSPDFILTKDMTVGDIGDVVIETDKIYLQPIVRYQYNNATKKFDKTLEIKDIPNGTWNIDKTPGFPSDTGKQEYDRLHLLYDKFKIINDMPTSLSDLYWVTEKSVALDYFYKFTRWMLLSRVSINILYPYGVDWYSGKKIYLELPRLDTSALVEEISWDKNNGIVAVKCIILTTDIVPPYYYQDTFEYKAKPEWADNYDGTGTETQDNL